MPDNVRCADCGYLAFQHRVSRQLCEAEETLRLGRGGPQDAIGPVYDFYPICFATEINFRERIGEAGDRETKRPAEVLMTRDCTSFTPWQQGFTPREHKEMIQEQARLEWQAKREDEDRKWRAEQARLAEQRYADEAKSAESRYQEQRQTDKGRFRWELFATILLLTVIPVCAQIVSALIERGILLPEKPAATAPPVDV